MTPCTPNAPPATCCGCANRLEPLVKLTYILPGSPALVASRNRRTWSRLVAMAPMLGTCTRPARRWRSRRSSRRTGPARSRRTTPPRGPFMHGQHDLAADRAERRCRRSGRAVDRRLPEQARVAGRVRVEDVGEAALARRVGARAELAGALLLEPQHHALARLRGEERAQPGEDVVEIGVLVARAVVDGERVAGVHPRPDVDHPDPGRQLPGEGAAAVAEVLLRLRQDAAVDRHGLVGAGDGQRGQAGRVGERPASSRDCRPRRGCGRTRRRPTPAAAREAGRRGRRRRGRRHG